MPDPSINPALEIAPSTIPNSQNHDAIWDVAIVGAGIAGLTCAQQLQQAGQRVVVLEKSRGFGGRAATKRLPNFRADAGLPYLTRSGELSSALIDQLLAAGVISPWKGQFYDEFNGDASPSSTPLNLEAWIAPEGANAIGKYLARSLTVWRSLRAIKLQPTSQGWQLQLAAVTPDADTAPLHLTARAVVLAIPAPQALELLETLQISMRDQPIGEFPGLTDLTDPLAHVTYDPCLTVIAGFNRPVTCAEVMDQATDGVTDRLTDQATDEVTDKLTDGVTDKLTDGATDQATDAITDGVTDGITDGITDGVIGAAIGTTTGEAIPSEAMPLNNLPTGFPSDLPANFITHWDAIELQHHSQVRWLGIESKKRSLSPEDPWVLTLHSTPNFAKESLEATNLEAIGAQLLRQIAHEFKLPQLAHSPDCLIVHRWRYAFVKQPAPLPPQAACLRTVFNCGDQGWALVCCGDWCGDDRLEAALRSAIAAAHAILET